MSEYEDFLSREMEMQKKIYDLQRDLAKWRYQAQTLLDQTALINALRKERNKFRNELDELKK